MEILEKRFVMKKSPTDACHASTVLKLSDGAVLCAWFGGTKEGNDDVSIYLVRRTGDGDFEEPVCMAASREPHWNPVLFQTEDGTVILYYKVGRKIAKWKTFVRISRDGGKTFSKEAELVPGDEGGRGPVRNKPVKLSSGRILFPASAEPDEWYAFADISDDDGKTYRKSSLIRIPNLPHRAKQDWQEQIPVSEQSFRHRGVIQPTIWEDKGQVHMLLRSSEGCLYRSDSYDLGEHWTDAYPTGIPNNNSGIDLAKGPDGKLYLVHNPVGDNWGARTPISLSVSEDGGEHFARILDLDRGPGEYSYPAVICDGRELCITYTYRRENIAFWRIKV